jgi:hypothetical protein
MLRMTLFVSASSVAKNEFVEKCCSIVLSFVKEFLGVDGFRDIVRTISLKGKVITSWSITLKNGLFCRCVLS